MPHVAHSISGGQRALAVPYIAAVPYNTRVIWLKLNQVGQTGGGGSKFSDTAPVDWTGGALAATQTAITTGVANSLIAVTGNANTGAGLDVNSFTNGIIAVMPDIEGATVFAPSYLNANTAVWPTDPVTYGLSQAAYNTAVAASGGAYAYLFARYEAEIAGIKATGYQILRQRNWDATPPANYAAMVTEGLGADDLDIDDFLLTNMLMASARFYAVRQVGDTSVLDPSGDQNYVTAAQLEGNAAYNCFLARLNANTYRAGLRTPILAYTWRAQTAGGEADEDGALNTATRHQILNGFRRGNADIIGLLNVVTSDPIEAANATRIQQWDTDTKSWIMLGSTINKRRGILFGGIDVGLQIAANSQSVAGVYTDPNFTSIGGQWEFAAWLRLDAATAQIIKKSGQSHGNAVWANTVSGAWKLGVVVLGQMSATGTPGTAAAERYACSCPAPALGRLFHLRFMHSHLLGIKPQFWIDGVAVDNALILESGDNTVSFTGTEATGDDETTIGAIRNGNPVRTCAATAARTTIIGPQTDWSASNGGNPLNGFIGGLEEWRNNVDANEFFKILDLPLDEMANLPTDSALKYDDVSPNTTMGWFNAAGLTGSVAVPAGAGWVNIGVGGCRGRGRGRR